MQRVGKNVKKCLYNCESYDYEEEPSNITGENGSQFAKVFIDDNLLPKEQKAFGDDLHVEEQGTVLIWR